MGDVDRRFEIAFAQAPLGMAIVALSGEFLRVNDALCRILGRSEAGLIGTTFQAITHADDLDADLALLERVVAGEIGRYRMEKRYVAADGGVITCQLDVALVRDTDGRPLHFVSQVQDVTEQNRVVEALERAAAAERKAHAQARLDNARLAGFLEHATDVVYVTDADGFVTYASPATEKLFGRAIGIGLPVDLDVFHPDDREAARAVSARVLAAPGTTVESVHRVRHGDDDWRHIEVTSTNHVGEDAIGGVVHNVRDITERTRAARQLEWQAYHDGLTGLSNRLFLMTRLAAMVEAARARDERVAVLFLDLDRFKVINDERGHDTGDQLLVEVGNRLQRTVRQGDEVGRLGGDEFVIVTGGGADEDVRALADRVRDALTIPIAIGGTLLAVSASIGIAYDSGQTPERLLRDADAALLRAKERGKNRVEVFNEALRVAAQRRLAVESNLRRVLDHEGVIVHHQPIVSLDDGRLVGAEALVRIPTADGRVELPAEYITLAEERGLIGALGEAVLDATCAALADWRARAGPQGLPLVAVNVAARQLGSPLFVSRLAEIVERHGLRPEDLALELKEATVIGADRTTVRTVDALQEMGVSLWLDDFGTGYSSLAYLKRFPIVGVKLDHSFVAELGSDPSDTEIVRAVIALGRALDLRVIAEGVETPTQLDTLRKLGCPCAQGYLLGAPTESERFDGATRDLDVLSGLSPRPVDRRR